MFEKIALLGAASLSALTGWTLVQSENPQNTYAAVPPERTYHYVHEQGGLREHVWVHRAAENRLEIYRTAARCGPARFATAWINPVRGTVSQLSEGRLMRGGRQEIYTTVRYDSTNAMLSAEVARADGMAEGWVSIDAPNWHWRGTEIATLSAQMAALDHPHDGFAFTLPMLAENGLQDGERIVARFSRGDEDAMHFALGGATEGSIAIDAGTGHLVAGRWSMDGGVEETIRLAGTSSGTMAWRNLLVRHYEGCQTA